MKTILKLIGIYSVLVLVVIAITAPIKGWDETKEILTFFVSPIGLVSMAALSLLSALVVAGFLGMQKCDRHFEGKE